MNSSPIPLLIDTDPGVDDALALLMAFADSNHQLLGLTIAAGNVGLQYTVANALKLCEVADIDVPVFPGCAVPLVHPAEDAGYVHGRDGFGDIGYFQSSKKAHTEHAAMAIIRLAHQHSGKLLLVTLGPLTNLALALRLDPSLPSHIHRLVIMGGAVTGRGNTSVSAEFNIGFDPEAADIVFRAFARFDLVDWEAVLRHGFAHADIDQWLKAKNPRTDFYQAISRKTRDWSEGRRGSHWHCADALAMAVALQPQGIIESKQRCVAIELTGQHSRGATIVDWDQRSSTSANANIVLGFDQKRLEQMMARALTGC